MSELLLYDDVLKELSVLGLEISKEKFEIEVKSRRLCEDTLEEGILRARNKMLESILIRDGFCNYDSNRIALVSQYGFRLRNQKKQTYDLCKIAVETNSHSIIFVLPKYQSTEICKMALNDDYRNLKYIYSQTDDLCECAISNNIDGIKYIRRKLSYDLLNKLIIVNPLIINVINFDDIDITKDQIKKLLILCAEKNPTSISNDKYRMLDNCSYYTACKHAVKKDPTVMKYVDINLLNETQYYKLCINAINTNWFLALGHIENKTEKILNHAFSVNSAAIMFITEPTEEQIKKAIDDLGSSAVAPLKKLSKDICELLMLRYQEECIANADKNAKLEAKLKKNGDESASDIIKSLNFTNKYKLSDFESKIDF